MKKLISLIAAVLFAGSMMAVDFTLSNAGTVTKDGVTVVFDKGTGQSAPAWYDKGLRLYAKNTVTISSESTITAISFNWEKQGSKDFNTVTASTGNYSHPSEAGVGSWTGEANSVVFTLGATGQLQLNTFSVTLGEGGGGETPAVATPVISGSETFTGSLTITMTCSTPDADIYYTTDGTTDPKCDCAAAPEYKAPFTITETTTIMAAAYTGNDWSAVATKTFTKVEPAQAVTCVDVYLMAKGDVVDLLNDVTVTYANGKNVWVKDGSAPMLIFLPSDGSYVPGDILSGVAGVVDIYNGVHEIKPTADQVSAITVTKGEAPAAIPVVNIDEYDVNKYIVMEGVQVSGSFQEGTQSNITVNGVVVRNQFKNGYTFAADKLYNIYGVVTLYQSNPQVYFITATEAGDAPGGGGQTGEITTCAAAAEAALSVSANNELYNNGASYTITGYVTSIAYAWKEGSMSFWMADTENGGNVLEAYKCAIANEADAVLVGDKVAVTGQLTKYNSTPEFAAGCTVEIIERAEAAKNLGEKTIAEFLELKNAKDTCILTGVVANIQNEEYGNFDLVDETGSVYIFGLLTPEGESKKFADLNVAEKDTLTVLAIYNEYNGNPQVKNAVFVEVKKAPAEDIEVTISSLTTPGALVWTDAVAAEGWWQIMGKNEFCDFSLSNISTTEAAGVYTVDDLDPDYSFISIYGETDTVDVAFTDGSVTVAIDAEGIVTINGTLVGSDGNNYIFNLTYKEPVAENTVEVQVSEANLIDDYAEYNLYGVYGYADDKTAYVQLGIWTEEGAGFEGQFTEDDLDFQYIGSAVIDATGSHNIFAAEITVTPGNNDGVYSITAKLLCYNDTLYVVTMQIGEKIDAIDHITNAVKASKLLRDGQLIIEKNGVRYNVNGQRIK